LKKSILALAAACSIATFPASAQQEIPAPLEYMVSSGSVELVKSFETEKEGLTGYVIRQNNGSQTIVYGFDEYAIAGVLINGEGENLTNRYADEHIPKPDYSSTADLLSQSEYLVTEGADDAPEMFVFSDPNCPYCKRFYQMSRQYVESGQVKINWVMVGFLAQSSQGIASAIMDGGMDVMNEAKTAPKGAKVPSVEVSPELANALQTHQEAMSAVAIGGTPGFLYFDGESWVSQSGMPKQAQFEQLLETIEK
jgi:thiol:disulfide interchange protein DsbG